MRYQQIRTARFLERPNRFIARVELDGEELVCHVKNTGRCRELLVPGATVYLSYSDRPNRKTQYDLVAVEKGARLINMDAQAPNAAAGEWLRAGGLLQGPVTVRPEQRYGSSRFDFCLEQQGRLTYVEVKGVTLERDGDTLFPDAPTARGTRHLRELIAARRAGYGAVALFIIQMANVRRFLPNQEMDPAFARALEEAQAAGVQVLARECLVTPETMTVGCPVPVILASAPTPAAADPADRSGESGVAPVPEDQRQTSRPHR